MESCKVIYYHCFECNGVYSDRKMTEENRLYDHTSEIPEKSPRVLSFTHPECFVIFKKRLELEKLIMERDK